MAWAWQIAHSRIATAMVRVVVLASALVPGAVRAVQVPDRSEPGLVLSLDQDSSDPEAPASGTFQVDEVWFNRQVFRVVGDTASIRSALRSNLALELDRVVKPWGLTTAQRQKLQQAVALDVKQFFDQVEAVRHLCQGRTFQVAAYPELVAALMPLKSRFARGFLKEGSLFDKTLQTIEHPAQVDAYRTGLRAQRVRSFQAMVRQVAASLSQRLELKADQRLQLEALMQDRIAPFRIVDEQCGPALGYKLALLPETELHPLMDDDQWEALRRFLQRQLAQGAEFRRRGYFEDEPPSPDEESLDPVERFAQAMPRPVETQGGTRP